MEKINEAKSNTNMPADNLIEIDIRKNYLKTFEDVEKKVKEDFEGKALNQLQCKTLSVVKNYINSEEFGKILDSISNLSCKSLVEIYWFANDLTYIPKELSTLTTLGACFANLQILILNNNKINKIENLQHLPSLIRLEMRTNRIKKWENLEELKNLKLLTLSCNLITDVPEIDYIPECNQLEELGLFGNFLGDEKDQDNNLTQYRLFLNNISTKFKILKKIFIGGNFFSRISNYKEMIKLSFPHLKQIDGEYV
jgi:Leucine-rich repeat (LRR) protein